MQTKILRNSHIYIREDRRQEKNSIRDDEGYFIMIKGSLHLEDGIILNVYVHNTRTTKYIKQKLTELRGETNKHPKQLETSTLLPQYLKRTGTLKVHQR